MTKNKTTKLEHYFPPINIAAAAGIFLLMAVSAFAQDPDATSPTTTNAQPQ